MKVRELKDYVPLLLFWTHLIMSTGHLILWVDKVKLKHILKISSYPWNRINCLSQLSVWTGTSLGYWYLWLATSFSKLLTSSFLGKSILLWQDFSQVWLTLRTLRSPLPEKCLAPIASIHTLTQCHIQPLWRCRTKCNLSHLFCWETSDCLLLNCQCNPWISNHINTYLFVYLFVCSEKLLLEGVSLNNICTTCLWVALLPCRKGQWVCTALGWNKGQTCQYQGNY